MALPKLPQFSPLTWWFMAGFGAILSTLILLLATGTMTVSRVSFVKSRCTSCGCVTSLLYYRIAFGYDGVNIPYGMDVNGGTSYCPHTLVYP